MSLIAHYTWICMLSAKYNRVCSLPSSSSACLPKHPSPPMLLCPRRSHAMWLPAYSPNNRLTRRSTLSFSGSYGWSLLGISRMVGNAAVYVSTRCRIRSAICKQVSHSVSPVLRVVPRRRHTCWLIRTMPMSLRSVVKRSKVASMVGVSVLLSTTRKFFWESGPGVTCCLVSRASQQQIET